MSASASQESSDSTSVDELLSEEDDAQDDDPCPLLVPGLHDVGRTCGRGYLEGEEGMEDGSDTTHHPSHAPPKEEELSFWCPMKTLQALSDPHELEWVKSKWNMDEKVLF